MKINPCDVDEAMEFGGGVKQALAAAAQVCIEIGADLGVKPGNARSAIAAESLLLAAFMLPGMPVDSFLSMARKAHENAAEAERERRQ